MRSEREALPHLDKGLQIVLAQSDPHNAACVGAMRTLAGFLERASGPRDAVQAWQRYLKRLFALHAETKDIAVQVRYSRVARSCPLAVCTYAGGGSDMLADEAAPAPVHAAARPAQGAIGASSDAATAALDALVAAEELRAMAPHDLSRAVLRAHRAAAAADRAAQEAREAAATKARNAADRERTAAERARVAAEEPHGQRFAGGVYVGPNGRTAQLVVLPEPPEVPPAAAAAARRL